MLVDNRTRQFSHCKRLSLQTDTNGCLQRVPMQMYKATDNVATLQ